jgi:lambda repressor-like predicted transcriptional regulator
MRLTALLAASLTAIVLATGASGAFAADKPSFADEVAKNLGVTPEKLRAAFKAALVARVDAAVKAGRLTPDQAAKLKERIAKAEGLGLGARKGFAAKRKAFGNRIGKAARGKGPAATYLGMTREALMAELKKGKSLAQVAGDKRKSVDGLVAAMVKPFQERLAKAVEAKRLTKQRADEILKRFTDATEKLVQRQFKPRPSSS